MRGLLMIEVLYHQTVAGNKTMTRRDGGLEAVNGCEATKTKPAIETNPDNWEETGCTMIHTPLGIGLESVDFCDYKDTQRNVSCKPRYRVGEVLYLKEPTILMASGDYVYKFNGDTDPTYGKIANWADLKWSNKLLMPASAARAYIRITGIKCERLLDISDEDCIAEGIEEVHYREAVKNHVENTFTETIKRYGFKDYQSTDWRKTLSPKDSFISLYKFANKMKPAAEIPNIWVFAYTFEYLPNYKP